MATFIARLFLAAVALVVTPVALGLALLILRWFWEVLDSLGTGVYGPWGRILLPAWHLGLHVGLALGAVLALVLLFVPLTSSESAQ